MIRLAVLTIGFVLLLSACDNVVAPSTLELQATRAGAYQARLSGDAEVPAVDTQARGQALFQLEDDGSALHYRLIVANIRNVVASHIHLGPEGQNGPVVAFLYGPVPAGSGRIAGVIAEGILTGGDLVGPLAGQTLAALLGEIEAGNAYVNVHTNDGIAPTNTGPGDVASGEVRGQIR